MSKLPYVTILQSEEFLKRNDKKGRQFSCELLTVIPRSIEQQKTIRPILAIFVGSQAEIRFVQANIRMGSKVRVKGLSYYDEIQFLKTENYHSIIEKNESVYALTIFDPNFMILSSGFINNSDNLQFCCPTSRQYIQENKQHCTEKVKNYIDSFIIQNIIFYNEKNIYANPNGLIAFAMNIFRENLEENFVLAKRFVSYLENKSVLPILNDDCFIIYLFINLALNGSMSIISKNLERISLLKNSGYISRNYFNGSENHFLTLNVNHQSFELFLAEITKQFLGIK